MRLTTQVQRLLSGTATLRCRAALPTAAAAAQPAGLRLRERAALPSKACGWQCVARQKLKLLRQKREVGAAAASATPAATSAFWPALVQAWSSNPAAVMTAAAACILGVSLSIFLLASIPTVMAMRRSAHALEALLVTVHAEVPDTAATLRLSGMELADCIQEVGSLSTDLTDGVRASARALVNAEQGLRQGVDMAGKAVTGFVLPQARDKVEAVLQERARLDYTAAVVRDTVKTTKTAAQRLRLALAASGLARGVATSTRYLRQSRGGHSNP